MAFFQAVKACSFGFTLLESTSALPRSSDVFYLQL